MSRRKADNRVLRHRRVRARVVGSQERPRAVVFRSLKHIRAQVIDDEAGRTLVSAADAELTKSKRTPVETAREVGKLLAGKARAKGIQAVIFDRAGYAYHGRVQALAEGAREGGLTF
jgi:large subunit ribosomal protein L18